MRKILILLLLFWGYSEIYSQKDVSKSFEYPFKQGDSKWKQYNSVSERIVALQIPNDVIRSIPTEELLEICLDFPYLTDIYFYDDYQKGFDVLISEFNGFGELLKRDNLYDVLLTKSKDLQFDIEKNKNASELEKGGFSVKRFVLEFLLAQDCVLMNLDEIQEKELLAVSIRNMEIKNSHTEIFGKNNVIPSYLLYAKRAVKDSKFTDTNKKEKIVSFVKSPFRIDLDVVECINRYLNKK